jgi:PAS domain S-box-containing protein
MSTGAKTGWAEGHRKEERTAGCKPVTVLGQDVFGNPFSQNTFTVEFSANGARLQGLPPLALYTMLLLECGTEQARYRVVWVGRKDTPHEGHVGLECSDQRKSIFGIDQPSLGPFYDEYKRVEGELQRSEHRFKSLFENSPGLICTHDFEGVLLSVNPAAASALGFESARGTGRNLAEFLAPSVRSQFPEYLRRVRKNGQDSGCLVVVARNRLKRIWLYRNVLVSDQASPPYILGHAMDITAQKNLEYGLQSALVELQKATAEVRTLKGLLPICAWCKKIRTQSGDWTKLEAYITAHSEANFSHCVCPECLPKIK